MSADRPDATGLREAVEEDLALLEFVGCQFGPCGGPDVPPEDMVTCRVCWRIRDLRHILAAHARIARGEGR